MSSSPNGAPVTKSELKTELAALKSELNTEFESKLAAQEERLLERMERVETNLLRAFRNWSISSETKLKVNDLLVRSFDDRLNTAEERIGELERRVIR